MSPLDGNDPVSPGHRGPLVESIFVKLTAPAGDRALWLRWTFLLCPPAPPRAELWAVAFTRGRAPRAAKRSAPALPEAVSRVPWRVSFGGSHYDGARTAGEVTAGAVSIHWELALTPRLGLLQPYPYPWMYRSPVVPTKTLTPLADAVAHGAYTVDGESVAVDGWRAMQGHNWGRRHTRRYAWSHAAGFAEDPAAVFEAFSARPAVGGRELPWLTMAFLHVDGAWLRFDGLAMAARAHTEVSLLRWDLALEHRGHRLRGTLEADPSEAAGLHYPNPTGPVTYCLNSKLARAVLDLSSPGAPARRFTSTAAALEIAWPFADHGVTMQG